jgi:hypothetical protein
MDDRLNAQIKRTWPRQIAFTLKRYPKLNLPGYVEYCARVRYRLIPLIW